MAVGALVVAAALTPAGPPAEAVTTPLPPGFIDETIAKLPQPGVTFQRLPDGRVFIAEKAGIVRVLEDGKVDPTPVVDISDHVAGHTTDPDEGTLPAGRLAWTIELVHCPGGTTDCHTHSLLDRRGITHGSFHVPDHGDSYRFRISLTATDAQGLVMTVTRDVLPQLVTLTLASSPGGLHVVFDQAAKAAPARFSAILGSTHRISFVSPKPGAGSSAGATAARPPTTSWPPPRGP